MPDVRTVITESGTRYEFDGRKVNRVLGDGSHETMTDGHELTYNFWGEPELGRRMSMIFDPEEYEELTGRGYVAPMRSTSPVVYIEYTDGTVVSLPGWQE